jgi:8-oxo-dGTP pyrophosphatase MutT (NUDIX family)
MTAKFTVVVSLVIERDGKVLLAKRAPTSGHAPGEWEGISGRLEPGESPADAAYREALEETGLTIELVAVLDTFHFFRGSAREDAIGITFHCRALCGSLQMSDEHDAFAWVGSEDLARFNLPQGLVHCIRRVMAEADDGKS